MIKITEKELISCFDCQEIVDTWSSNGNDEELRCNECALKYYQGKSFSWVTFHETVSVFSGSTV